MANNIRPWPDRAIHAIERVVKECPTGREDGHRIAWIAWGEPVGVTKDDGCLSALLNWAGDFDFELSIYRGSDTDSAWLRYEFRQSLVLPREAPRLYEVITICGECGIRMRIAPSTDGEILISGIELYEEMFDPATLTGDLLDRMVRKLGFAARDIKKWIVDGVGENHWEHDSPALPDDEEPEDQE
jgi:hypothetical protein